ncbi:DNA ligase 4 [Frankliniella fusca]|uniref:DNA ligase 4 n=1 Tax=Frankliniella fusca TaxID=407009 RepID=A0AAE1HTN4_9NEOP|nr:DNA ligase 4 [Frankliniella fusca]
MDGGVKFHDLCEVLEKISVAPKDKKAKLLSKFIQTTRQSTNSLDSFFTIVRLLLPYKDNIRGNYGIKSTTLANIYIRMLCLPKDGADANKLLKFRCAADSSAGDFADVAYWVLRSRCRDGGKLTAVEVDSRLTNIATLKANHNPRGIEELLTDVLLRMSAFEQKWFIRLLLKNLRLGLSDNEILNKIHPDGKELYDQCTCLKKVCEEDTSKRLHEINISLFQACLPMKSDRLDILAVDTIIRKEPFYYVERKHDGERFQIHMDNGKFRYFSSQGKDYTDNFGETRRLGILTPALAGKLNAHVQTCILDGEMMAWNTKLNCYASKAKKIDVKYLKTGDLHCPCFCVFDVLMLNGEILTNKPLEDRVKVLKGVFTPLEGVIMETPQKCVTTSSEIVDALNKAIDNQEEGLIVKEPSSVYKPATKKGGWYKIKPEYTVGLTDELDLIILGGYFGEGRRKANISHFLVGVAVSPVTEGANPVDFYSVGRVGSGYSRDELAELLQKLSPYWRPVKRGFMPDGLHWTKEKPDVWIEPQKSQILQVKATEIMQSNSYKTGYTLRFPRVEKVRYDKSWLDCCTTTEFEKLRLSNSGKLASRHVMASDLDQAHHKKQPRTKISHTVARDYLAADLTGSDQRGSLFTGKEICVLSGNDKMSKQEIEKCIYEQGGSVVQNRGPETFCIIAGKEDFRLKNVLGIGVNVVTVDWFLRVLCEKRLVEWTPRDLRAMSPKTCENMLEKYDRFCDSFHNPTNMETLQFSLDKVAEEGCALNLLPSEMADLDIELFSDLNKFAVFRCCVALFIPSKLGEFSCEISKALFQFYGGRRSEEISHDLTHIVINSNDTKNLMNFQNVNRTRPQKFYIVSYQWVEACCEAGARLGEFT